MGNGKQEIWGLILTAGYSSRMGRFKPLLQIGDMTAIERIISTLKRAGIPQIVGVTGYQRELLLPIFEKEEVLEAYNRDYSLDMFTSMKRGISCALTESPNSLNGFLLMLADCPLIPADVIRLVLETHENHPEAFIVPCYQGKKGHPLFIPACYAQEILSYEGEGGLKAIMKGYEHRLIKLEVDTEAVVLDMDTPEGYEELLEFYHQWGDGAGLDGQGGAGEPCWSDLLKGKRLFFVRHGEIQQHKEKIFLGQWDVPLSDKGRKQASSAALELQNYKVSVNRIYTSDLSRAAETASIIRGALQSELAENSPGLSVEEIRLIFEPKLKELSLGEWDGRFISEIREEYPEEYQKRGEKLLTYKFGNDSENFYDLQYRAMKGLQSILKKELQEGDHCKDVVIVAHLGVINVLLSNLNHTDLEDQIRNYIPNGGVIVMDYTGDTRRHKRKWENDQSVFKIIVNKKERQLYERSFSI